jgi:hypothetical protein
MGGSSSTLKHLDLRGNDSLTKDADAIAEALACHVEVERLEISSNKLGDAGVQAVAKMLLFSTSLKCLSLSNNEI